MNLLKLTLIVNLFFNGSVYAETLVELDVNSKTYPAISAKRMAYSGNLAPQTLQETIRENALKACIQEGFDTFDEATLETEIDESTSEPTYFFTENGYSFEQLYDDSKESLSYAALATILHSAGTYFRDCCGDCNDENIGPTLIALSTLPALVAFITVPTPYQVVQAFQAKEIPYLEVTDPNYNRYLTQRDPTHSRKLFGLKFSQIFCKYNQKSLQEIQNDPDLISFYQRHQIDPDELAAETPYLIHLFRSISLEKKRQFLDLFSKLPSKSRLLRIQNFDRLIASNTGIDHLASLASTQAFLENVILLIQSHSAFANEPISVSQFPVNFRFIQGQVDHQLLLEKLKTLSTREEMRILKKVFKHRSREPKPSLVLSQAIHHWGQKIVLDEIQSELDSMMPVKALPQAPPEKRELPEECEICFSDAALLLGPADCACFAYCQACAEHQLHSTRSDTQISLCPEPNCKREIEESFFRTANCQNLKELEQFQKHQLAWKLKNRVHNWRFCRGRDCMNGEQIEHRETLPEALKDNHFECPACNFKGCLDCGNSHPGEDCEDGRRSQKEIELILEKGAKPRNDFFWTQPLHPNFENGKFRPCAYCGKIVERRDGCNSMDCPECENKWHWNEGKPDPVPHDFTNDTQNYQLENGVTPHF